MTPQEEHQALVTSLAPAAQPYMMAYVFMATAAKVLSTVDPAVANHLATQATALQDRARHLDANRELLRELSAEDEAEINRAALEIEEALRATGAIQPMPPPRNDLKMAATVEDDLAIEVIASEIRDMKGQSAEF